MSASSLISVIKHSSCAFPRMRGNALLVPPRDAEAMAGAVRRILTEPSLAERLSRNARLRAEAHGWSVVLPHWEELLEKVAAGG